MPDFFEGEPADISWYPPDNKEKEQKLGEFFQTKAAPPKTLPRIPKIVDELTKSKGIEKWAIVGYCWGGKVELDLVMSMESLLTHCQIVNLSSQKDTKFKVAAACHPAMVAKDDAPGITIPYIMLPSGDVSSPNLR